MAIYPKKKGRDSMACKTASKKKSTSAKKSGKKKPN